MSDEDFDMEEIEMLIHPIPTPESMIKSRRGKTIIFNPYFNFIREKNQKRKRR